MFLKYVICLFLIFQVVTPKVIPRSPKGHIGSQEEYDAYITGFNDDLHDVSVIQVDFEEYFTRVVFSDVDANTEEKLGELEEQLVEMQHDGEINWGAPGVECLLNEKNAITKFVFLLLNGTEVCRSAASREGRRIIKFASEIMDDLKEDLRRVTSGWESCEEADVECRIAVVETADSLYFNEYLSMGFLDGDILNFKEADVKNMLVCVSNEVAVFNASAESMIQRVNQCWEGLN